MAPTTIVGIDLGTTNSVVASLDPTGRPFSATNFEGAIITPSAVLIEGDAVVVGREALKAAPFHPDRFAECFKRYMGEEAYPHKVDGQTWRPEVLSALVLRRLKVDAGRRLGAVEEAVITVPAYFDESRRRATWNAARIAGWRAADLINEPTAAAVAFAHQQSRLGQGGDDLTHVLVYDLGGGTFDTTVLQIRRGREYRTLATDGELQLGGHDWDDRLAESLADQFRRKAGTDPLGTAHGRIEFLQFARSVKHSLSARKKVSAPCLLDGRRAILEADRDSFEKLTSDLLHRTRVTTELVLAQAKKGWAEIDRVLLVGGSTRMPMVSAMFAELLGRPPDASLDPDEAVAHGAAVYAGLRGRPDAPRVIDVNSHTYRVLCHDKQHKPVAVPMIARNSPLPAEFTRPFPIARAAAGAVAVAMVEGESDDPEACETIGEIVVPIPPPVEGRRRLAYVTVICRADGSLGGITRVKLAGDKEDYSPPVAVELTPKRGLSAEQVEGYRRWMDSITVN